MWWFEALVIANQPKKICLGPKAIFFLFSHGTHLETYSYYENIPMVRNATILQLYSQILVSGQMQLYCILWNYMQLMQLYATILQLMQLYCNYMQLYCNLCNYIATICSYIATILYATILQQFCMQLYCNYATIWNMPYATCLSNDKSFKNSM